MFEKKGELVVDGTRYSEDDLMPAIDAGAEDVALDGDVWEIVTGARRPAGGARGARAAPAWRSSPPSWCSARPRARRSTRTACAKLMSLIEALEEHDDVQAVHANFDVDAEVLERVAAA